MTQNVANLCVRCEHRFNQWAVYHAHVTANKCAKKIVPTRTTQLSFNDIVENWESKQKLGAIIK